MTVDTQLRLPPASPSWRPAPPVAAPPSLRRTSAIARWTPRRLLLTIASACLVGAWIPRLGASYVLLALAACLVVATVAAHPPLAAYALLGVTPLIAGIDRGTLIPLLRPNEGFALLLAAGLVARGLSRVRTGCLPKLTITSVDVSM